MPWEPLPRIAFAIATHPFNPTGKSDLPIELGDELYLIESCNNGQWFRGYLVAPPSLLSGLTSRRGQTLEARVFSGIFPSACVKIRELLGPELPLALEIEDGEEDDEEYDDREVEEDGEGDYRERDEDDEEVVAMDDEEEEEEDADYDKVRDQDLDGATDESQSKYRVGDMVAGALGRDERIVDNDKKNMHDQVPDTQEDYEDDPGAGSPQPHRRGDSKHGIQVDVNVRERELGEGDEERDDGSLGETSIHVNGNQGEIQHLDDDVDRDSETEASYPFLDGLHHPPRHHLSTQPQQTDRYELSPKERHQQHSRLSLQQLQQTSPKMARQSVTGSELKRKGSAAKRLPRSTSKSSRTDKGKQSKTPKSQRPRSRPPAPVPMLKIGDETATHDGEPLVDEIASCLREWHSSNVHELLLTRQYSLLESLSTLVQHLDLARKQLLHNVLTSSELIVTREKTVWELVRGNKLLGREIIVREPASGRILTGDDSAITITTLQAQMSLLDAPPVEKTEGVTLHHLLLDLKAFVGITPDLTTLVFYLTTRQNKALTECFSIDISPQGVPVDFNQFGRLQTLFIDLNARDLTEEVYLVAKVLTKASAAIFAQERPSMHASTSSISSNAGVPVQVQKGGRMSTLFSGSSSRSSSLPGKGNLREQTLMHQQHQHHQQSGMHGSMGGFPTASAGSVTGSVGSSDGPRSRGHGGPLFRKTLGVGVLDVTRFLRQDQGVEQVMKIFVPRGMGSSGHILPHHHHHGSSTDVSHERDWEALVRDIIESRTDRFETTSKADRLHFYLRPFTSPDSEELIKSTPTLLQNVVPTQRIGFSGAPTKPRSDIYFTLCRPHIPRHPLALHHKNGWQSLPNSSNVHNMQVTLEVRRSNGDIIPDCVHAASNIAGVGVWSSSLVNRDESWHEVLRLAVPEEAVRDAHVYMTLSNGPGAPPIAFAWTPLWENGAFAKDGDRKLPLHRYYHSQDEQAPPPTSHSQHVPSLTSYLELTPDPSEFPHGACTLDIRTFLCSTKLTQDQGLLNLLNWDQVKAEADLIEILKKFPYIPELEVVKLLHETFDALFSILVERAGRDEFEDLIFMDLVTVLNIVYDRRFHLEPIVDDYVTNHFSYPFATACLTRSFSRLLSNPTDPEASKKLRATFKVGRHIFRFISFARAQQKIKEADIGITSAQQSFTKDLQHLFKLLESLMSNPAPMLVGSQTIAVQYFHTWLPELDGILTTDNILLLAIDFLDACAAVKGRLILFKLVLIVNFCRLPLFNNADAKRALAVNSVRWLDPCWGKTDDVNNQYREQVRLCCSVLSAQIDELTDEVPEYMTKIVDSFLAIRSAGVRERETFSLLFPKNYPFVSRPIPGRPTFDEALLELAAIFAQITAISPGLVLDIMEPDSTDFLMNALTMHLSILSCEAFPSTWLSVHIYHHKSTMRFLEMVAGVLLESFIPEPDDAESFNMELWKAFFTTLLKLVGSDALALETFPEQKRRAVWKVGGDVREQGAELLQKAWETIGWETSQEERQQYHIERLGGFQVQYVPALVAPIVELCLSVHEGLRNVAVEVLQSMIISEWCLSEDLSVIKAEMIDSLDQLFKEKHLTESITQKLFLLDLSALFESLTQTPEDPLFDNVKELLATLDEFLSLLVAVHSTPVEDTYHIMDTLRLMNFLKDMQKEDMFIRYVHRLVNLQIEAGNLVEAGLSMQLHADLYDWDTATVVPALQDPEFPEQTKFDRREEICFRMINYFEQGKSWENALDVYKELAEQYESVVFDYVKLAKAHRAIAKLHENISRGDRYIPRFFKVSYVGMGFPTSMRNKQFIMQGNNYETLASFSDRIQEQHPLAKVTFGEVDTVEGQYLQVVEVFPELDILHPVYQQPRIAGQVRDFLQACRPKLFSTVPVAGAKNLSGTDSEKTVFETIDTFPTILRRSEVINVVVYKCNPFQRGIDAVTRCTEKMNSLEKQISANDFGTSGREAVLNEFTECLTSAVNGQIDEYRILVAKAPADPEDQEHPELVRALSMAILDHVRAVKKCLVVRGRFYHNTNDVQENLMRLFEKNFAAELSILTPLPTVDTNPLSPSRSQGFSPNEQGTISSTDTMSPTSRPTHLQRNMSGSSGPSSKQQQFTYHQQNSSTSQSQTHVPSETTSTSKRERLSLIFSHSNQNSNDDVTGISRENSQSHSRSRSRSKGRADSVSSSRRPSTTSSTHGNNSGQYHHHNNHPPMPNISATVSSNGGQHHHHNQHHHTSGGGGGGGGGGGSQIVANGVERVGSVRKRLSLLSNKIGGKKGKMSPKDKSDIIEE